MIIDSSRQEFGLGISMSSFSAPEVWGLNWKTQRQEVNLSKGACICVREKEREREEQRQRDKDREITPVNCHVNVRLGLRLTCLFCLTLFIAKSQRTAQDQERRKYIPLHDWEC